MSVEKNKRKVWTREETLGFLKCYTARKEEFNHIRKKKNAYQNVPEDMLSDNLTDSSTTTSALESKMRTLLIAYKAAKDNSRQTGASPCLPPFYDEMEKLFGDSPIICNSHTLQLGQGPTQPLIIKTEHIEPIVQKKRKVFYKEEYYQKKLEIKRNHLEEKAKRKDEFLKGIENTLKDKMDKQLDVETKKMKLLEAFLNKST